SRDRSMASARRSASAVHVPAEGDQRLRRGSGGPKPLGVLPKTIVEGFDELVVALGRETQPLANEPDGILAALEAASAGRGFAVLLAIDRDTEFEERLDGVLDRRSPPEAHVLPVPPAPVHPPPRV